MQIGLSTGLTRLPGRSAGGGGGTDPHFANVSLLLHGDGLNGSTVFTDSSSSPKTPTVGGNVQISTAQSKFGTGSIAFDGVGDYLEYAPDNAFELGPIDFTMETFLRFSAYSASYAGEYGAAIFSSYRAGGGSPVGFQLRVNGTASTYTTINLFTGTNDLNFGGFSLSLNNWYHIAVSRSSGVIRAFVDGVQYGSSVANTDDLATNQTTYRPFRIGQLYDPTYLFSLNGNLDECRITKGVGRYAANFTPPPAPFPNA